MTIEPGEYFAVVRGFEHGRPVFAFSGFGEQPRNEKPQYDRSYEGDVFLALAVSGPLIAARRVLVSNNHWKPEELRGKVINLNTTEIEIWPLSAAHCEALGIGVDQDGGGI